MAKNQNIVTLGVGALAFFLLGKCMTPSSVVTPPEPVTSSESLAGGQEKPQSLISSGDASATETSAPKDSSSSSNYITGSGVAARDAPSSSSRVLRTLTKGESVTVISRKKGWVKVAGKGVTYWVRSKHISFASNAGIRSKRTRSASLSHTKKHSRRSSFASSGSCPCGSGHICIGPRGGRFCMTSGGNKEYGQ